MNALVGSKTGALACSLLLLTLRGRPREQVLGRRGREPCAVDWACSRRWRSSSSSAPVVGPVLRRGKVDALRSSTSGETASRGEVLGEFSMVEGGATPSPHRGGRPGGLSRRALPCTLLSTIPTGIGLCHFGIEERLA